MSYQKDFTRVMNGALEALDRLEIEMQTKESGMDCEMARKAYSRLDEVATFYEKVHGVICNKKKEINSSDSLKGMEEKTKSLQEAIQAARSAKEEIETILYFFG